MLAHMLEILAWGDAGMYLVTPGGGLGAAAVQSAGSPEQRKKFLGPLRGEKPTFAAMCMTEAGAGSDTSSIRATAVLDEETNEWILNGEKIFVTAGDNRNSLRNRQGRVLSSCGRPLLLKRDAPECALSLSKRGHPASA